MAKSSADPVVAGDTVVLGTADGSLHGLNVDTGSLEWTHDTGDYPLSAAPSVSERTLFVPTADGKLTGLAGQMNAASARLTLDSPVPILAANRINARERTT